MKYIQTHKNFESLDLFDKEGPGYINVDILKDILVDIEDETSNDIIYPSELFREMPFGGGIRFRHWNKKYVSYCLKFNTFISVDYYSLIKYTLEYYYKETGDEIFCFIYSRSSSYIEKIYFIRMYALGDIVKLESTDKILTKDGFYTP